MRLAIVGLALAAPPAALAQTAPYAAAVSDAEAKLRAGPSDSFPETAALPRGATLVVDHEEPNGWLAVQDPPGAGHSLSWVRTTYIDFDKTKPPPQRVVVSDGTTLAVGRMGLAEPLKVQRTPVPGGTVLRVIGPEVEFEGKLWRPVEPPAGDFRYVPKAAVTAVRAENSSFTVRDTIPPPADLPASGGRQPPDGLPHQGADAPRSPARTPEPAKPAVDHPLWARADAAERDGRLDDAEKLLFQLAKAMNETGGNHDVANRCYTRIHTLREKKRAAAPPPPPPPAAARPPAADAGSLPKEERPQRSGPGRLVRSALALDGRKTYALEPNPGVAVVYVVAGPGVDLERWVNRRVEVTGAVQKHRDVQKPYVVATGVEAAP